MAYTKNIEHRCPCGKPATVEVFNNRNASFGRYCKACGSKRAADLTAKGA